MHLPRPSRAILFRAAALTAVVGLQAAGPVNANWVEDFSGNQIHDPTAGKWTYAGFTLSADPQEIPNWAPVYTNNRANVPRPGAPGGQAMILAAGWVASVEPSRAHHYLNVRVAGTVGVGNNGGGGNNSLVGLLARADEYDVYVLAIDHNTHTLEIQKSYNSDPTDPTTIASEPIVAYTQQQPYYLEMDVFNVAGGTRLVGRIYEDSSRNNLFNSITAFDDDGGAVPGATLPAFYSGWFAQYNTSAGTPTTLDAYFDDLSSTTLRPGDANLDGTVNRADVARVVANLGKSVDTAWDDGDLDGDGRVGVRDLMQVQRALPTGPVIINPPVDLAAAAVPEPAGAWLAVFAALSLSAMARRRTPCGSDDSRRD